MRGNAVWQTADINKLLFLETAAVAKEISLMSEGVGPLVELVCDLISSRLHSVWSFFLLIESASVPTRLSSLLIVTLRVASLTNALAKAS